MAAARPANAPAQLNEAALELARALLLSSPRKQAIYSSLARGMLCGGKSQAELCLAACRTSGISEPTARRAVHKLFRLGLATRRRGRITLTPIGEQVLGGIK